MKLRIALLAVTTLAAPFALSHAASAQPVTGPYVAGGAGYNLEESPKAKNIYLNGPTTDSGHITMHNGFTGEASLGYGFGNGFRAELEGDYFDNTFSKQNFNGQQHRPPARSRNTARSSTACMTSISACPCSPISAPASASSTAISTISRRTAST